MSSLNAWSCSFLRLDDIVVWYTIIAKIFSPTYIRRNPQTLLLFLQTFFLLKGKLDWHVPNTALRYLVNSTKTKKCQNQNRIYKGNCNNHSSSLPLLTKETWFSMPDIWKTRYLIHELSNGCSSSSSSKTKENSCCKMAARAN